MRASGHGHNFRTFRPFSEFSLDFYLFLLINTMPKRKFSSRRRSVGRKRRRTRFKGKRVPPKRAILAINKHPLSYIREIPANNLTIPLGDNKLYFANSFAIGALPNIAEFTPLFDQYRIRYIIAKFRLVAPPEANAVTAQSQFYPDIYVTVDHDDAVTPTAVDQVLQYGKCKRGILRPNRWFKYKFYPTAALQLYRSATTTAYAPAKNSMWMDLANTDMPYYGLKGVISNEASGVTVAPIAIEYHLVYCAQFRNCR